MKDLSDKIRCVLEKHNSRLPEEKKVKEINVKVTNRIGYNNKEQIIVTYT